jgi:hypothetical protein
MLPPFGDATIESRPLALDPGGHSGIGRFHCPAPIEDPLLDRVDLALKLVTRLVRHVGAIGLQRLEAPVDAVKFDPQLIT